MMNNQSDMMECVLEDKICINCGRCDYCDLDETKICDNCMECIEDEGFRAVEITDVKYT
ncbi:MAG: hypothetical protein ACQEQI_00400 [Bacillota bacterium]